MSTKRIATQHGIYLHCSFFLSSYFLLYLQTLTDLYLYQNPGGYSHAVGIYIKIQKNPVLF
jgi:hypothetical protein